MLRALIAAVCLSSCAARAEAVEFTPATIEDPATAVHCLSLAIAYEAGYESLAGQQAVAEVVLNRWHDAAFPKTVCGVVFAGAKRRTGCQFTFTCDGSLYRRQLPARVLQAARVVAIDALAGRLPSRVPFATHYHADYVHLYWASTLVRPTKIGAHIFYLQRANIAAAPLAALPPTHVDGPSSVSTPFTPWGLTLPAIPRRP
ncbi:cell wall hydrolase [Sphingomonas sp. 8AM]|uniref:cell wall hydrolase n=1 Tax=Sphingomonas sp. 8AM TaxID=2653170 RepID=UPI0012F1F88A|nr:cell wall hydrolase [Sphingomonas sp. 8AM]VXD01485.1 Cell wall hydrolase [Sphingomonas sp. 8AM]